MFYFNLFKNIYYISTKTMEEEDWGFEYLKNGIGGKHLELVSLNEELIIEGLDQLLVQERSKTYHLWKKKLSKKF
ncbi:hypothetical protein AZF37_08410 [endosymbiont 'TC1' of Trimyema compressum]|uniref:hypothetical protein n=1 Tax=endosymbiont 'TC1' of Trimyema compressum TaxID=243899 RepID=UPI0007F04D9C|nr:hypothetical protein [endosymbiont 'TC1' of Trimyema compressum]AMP21177.1 hypothetical protein AZF37_08410 [endosymbiont 'TC1' of Trimyema compressum]